MSRRFPKVDPNDPDEVLVKQAQTATPGDTRAFAALVTRHKGHVKANCRFLSGSETDAEDLAQEVFVKAYVSLRSFEGRAQFKSWIQRIKINHCLNFLRKRKGKSFLDVNDPAAQGEQDLRIEASAERTVSAMATQHRVREVLQGLPDTLRVPLTMCDMDGYSYQEIADSLGIGLSATKMRIKRGREEFRLRFAGTEVASAGSSAPANPGVLTNPGGLANPRGRANPGGLANPGCLANPGGRANPGGPASPSDSADPAARDGFGTTESQQRTGGDD